MANATLLFTSCGGELAPETIQRVKASTRHDIRLIGVDFNEHAIGRHFADAFVRVPMGTAPDYADRVLEIAVAEGVDIVQPLSDEEALALSERRADFEARGIQVAANDYEKLRIFTDKAATYDLLRERGFWVPEYFKATTLDELAPLCDDLFKEYREFVVKPAHARGSRGTYVVRSDITDAFNPSGSREVHVGYDIFRRDILPSLAEYLPIVAMRRLRAPVYDVDMLSWHGVPHRLAPRRRIDPTHPNLGHVLVGDPKLIELADQLVRSLELSWLIDIDVMEAADGTPAIIEINPRPSGSVSTVLAAGLPLYDDLISLARGEALEPMEIPFGRRIISFMSLKALSD